MRLRCKPGDLALVIYDTPPCRVNIGRTVRVFGPLNVTRKNGACWLIQPTDGRKWAVEPPNGRVEMRDPPLHMVEHADHHLLPIRPPRKSRRKKTQQPLIQQGDGLKNQVQVGARTAQAVECHAAT